VTKPLALVTGGSRGVGRAVVLELARHYRVAFSCRRDIDAAAEVVSAVRAAGGAAMSFTADLSAGGAAGALVGAVESAWGPVSAVIGNAGAASRGLSCVDTTPEEYLRMFQVHALSNIELAAAAMPSLRAARGAVVFVSSAVAELLPAGTAPYAAAKAALEAAAVVLAREERASGVRVNTVAPGLWPRTWGTASPGLSTAASRPATLTPRRPWGTSAVQRRSHESSRSCAARRRRTSLANGSGSTAAARITRCSRAIADSPEPR
jgi:NAD(P)-dependent dehydrogenase (short-subunit alcohol dehydrogenase family)